MIGKAKNPGASENNILKLTDGNNLCCGDDPRFHYLSAVSDVTSATTISAVNVTDPGGSAATIALAGAPIDWADSANDEALIQAIGKVVTDKGYIWMGGGISIERSADDIQIRVQDSVLEWNWAGTASSNEAAFTQYSPY